VDARVSAPELFSQALRHRWWQRAIQLAPVRIILGVLILMPAAIADGALASRSQPLLSRRVVVSALVSLLLLASLAAFARLVERRRPRELSFGGAFVEWLVGLAGGIALLATTVGLLVAFGLYRVGTGGTPMALVTGLAFFAPHALLEEILLRSLVFKITEEAIGSRAALAIQAALFGAMHLGNPSATLFAAIAIMLEAGLLLAVAYMVTRRIWLAWGLHLGWNYAQGSLFGIRVSGTPVGSSFLVSSPMGPESISGGAFGVEASPIAIAVCLAATVVLWRIAVRRSEIVTYATGRERFRAMRGT
jgi:membrane protease YdiL (CAAX protease family)